MRRLALTVDGKLTYCTATPENVGKGKCNHVSHQNLVESAEDFLTRIKSNEIKSNDYVIIHNNTSTKSTVNMLDGIQTKFYQDGKFIKLDLKNSSDLNKTQRNGLSEEMCTKLLECSNLSFIPYKSCKINLNGSEYVGCYSRNILKDGESMVPVEHILSQGLYEKIETRETNNIDPYFDSLVNEVKDKTGYDCSSDLLKTISFDILVLNGDRHLGNVNLIHGSDGWRFSPVFDNGEALMSDSIFDDCDEINFWDREEEESPTTFGLSPMDDYFELITSRIKTKRDILQINKKKFEETINNYNNAFYDKRWVDRAKSIMLERLNEYEDILWINNPNL